MHLLRIDSTSLDDTAIAVDLEQTIAPLVFLSFTDSDLAALGTAWQKADFPPLRLAKLTDLKHPYSVDLWLESVATHAKTIVVRLLGGMDYWRYGVEQLAAAARVRDIRLVFIPGDYQEDSRLVTASTVEPGIVRHLWSLFQNGGPANMQSALQFMAGGILQPVAKVQAFGALTGACGCEVQGAPRALIVFYRSAYLSDDFEPVSALAEALQKRGFHTCAVYVSSLKDPAATDPMRHHLSAFQPDVIFNTTAFSAKLGEGGTILDHADAPVFQVIMAGSSQQAWLSQTRGLNAADQAMNVVLPEVDGRIVARAVSFKAQEPRHADLEHAALIHRSEASRIDFIAELATKWSSLRRLPNLEKRIALVLSDYPSKGGRTGYAVGLDTPNSVLEIVQTLQKAGYTTGALPSAAELMRMLTHGERRATLSLNKYVHSFARLPLSFQQDVTLAWGEPIQDEALVDGFFSFRFVECGKLIICIQPERGRAKMRKGDYHDTNLPPCHSYIAFYMWLRAQIDVLVHVGAHGTLEWLPGKSVALSDTCAPEVVLGPTPVIYPFIVNNPGEAAQAKRRLAAVTLGHMTPPLVVAGVHGALAELEGLMDEYAQAETLDPRRAKHLAGLIMSKAQNSGWLEESGTADTAPGTEALSTLDGWLCDIKDMRIGDGLHVFGQGPCGNEEQNGLLKALSGRFVAPGPAGAPSQGRMDVLPTGRNLYTIDPRAIPSRTAWEIGKAIAQEVLETYAQEHGEWPKSVFLDLWASTSMRTGGDDLAQAFAFLGVRPKWDDASTRVNGFEILPLALLGRARVDVTLRISGLFRDVFPMQIALFDAAVKAVAALDEPLEDNPLVAKHLTDQRIFGSAPGTYGLGLGETLARGTWQTRDDLGNAYIAANSYAYGTAGDGVKSDAFAARVAATDAFVHVQDMAGQDVLDSDAFAQNEGGFAAAAASLGKAPAIYHTDNTLNSPKVRTLQKEVARVLRARATNPVWLAGQMRHGYRGASEIAETVDNVFNFAALAAVVNDAQFDALFDATLGNSKVRDFLRTANLDASQAIENKFKEALQRGLWTSRRNSVLAVLAEEILP